MNESQELIPASGQDFLLINVIPDATREWCEGLLLRAANTPAEITDEASAGTWADLLNQSAKGYKSLNDRRLEIGREYDRAKDARVNLPVKPWLDRLSGLKDQAQRILSAHAQKVEAERRRIMAEQEAEREKARQLAIEAEARKAKAADSVEKAKTDGQFEKAAEAFDKGVAADIQATEMLISASSAPAPEAFAAKGVKTRMKVEGLTVTDLSKLALTYHMADLKKIEKHILDGTLSENTPGISFRLVPVISATGR